MTIFTELVADVREWWVELAPHLVRSSWQQSQHQNYPGRQWDAYLGRLCLGGLLPWLQEMEIWVDDLAGNARPWLNDGDWPALWDCVGGCAIELGERWRSDRASGRLVLIPSDDIEAQELVVPQEWVDLPDWAGHYYLAVQVHREEDESLGEDAPERQWLRVWGYASHRLLKQQADYDPERRTYTLSAPLLADDMTTLGVTLRYCGIGESQAALEPLPTLSDRQRENLLDRLGPLALPRLEIPFPQWGALLQDPGWRQRLYERRCGSFASQVEDQIVRLSRWLEGQFELGWRSLEDLLGPDLAFAPQLRSLTATRPAPTRVEGVPLQMPQQRAKRIDLGEGAEAIALALIIWVMPTSPSPSSAPPGEPAEFRVQVQLHPLQGNTLPSGVSLGLQVPDSLDLDPFDSDRTTSDRTTSDRTNILQTLRSGSADTYLQLTPFTGVTGEQFQIEVAQASSLNVPGSRFVELFCL